MNPVAISFGFINIYWYSILIGIGALIGLFYAIKEAERHNIPKDFMIDAVLWGFPIGIVGARIYYVLFNLDYYGAYPGEIFKIYEGGLAIHGGIIAGFIFAYFYTKKKGYNWIKIIDITSVSILIGQIFGRWGNFINQEAHGGEVSRSFLEKLPIPNFIIEGMYINGAYYHPTFLYESVWNIIGLIILLIYRNNKNIKLGEMTLIYLGWYSLGRFFIESLRTDALMLGSIRVAMLLSAVLFFGAIITIIIIKRKSKKLYNKGE
jgi:phosphatidylglycerol:prolipoprotein diacylglycerol transferase